MSSISNLQDYVTDAVEVVDFRLVRDREDAFDPSNVFHPEMAHQIFGETERIFGYKDLRIDIMYLAGPMKVYVGMRTSQCVKDFIGCNMKADDVIGAIVAKFPSGGYYTNIDEYLNQIEKANDFKPYGEKLQEFIVEDCDGIERTFEMYRCDVTMPEFFPFFERLQTFILWFIDAASYVEVDDPQWMYFVCYEKFKNVDGNTQFATVGYTTLYQYYAYPEHIRPRISQMLVLPPFQKMGIGAKFIESIYQYYKKNDKILDITVENPSSDFQRIRCFVDAKLCMQLPCFSKEVIKNGYTKEMADVAKKNFKINTMQARRVYEVIRLYYTNVHNEKDYRDYRLEVKKRLNMQYEKEMKSIERLKKAGFDEALLKDKLINEGDRLEKLHSDYEEAENEYDRVVERLKYSEL
uniref:Histone acetyltransferase type B catalytic subunit n=1 Tax=Tabanus bromius TaxID=304241 RepID=A0A0K8TT35_TABBR